MAYAQVPDQALWGRREYWATPVETSARGAGDCEVPLSQRHDLVAVAGFNRMC